MPLHGSNLIGSSPSQRSSISFTALDPETGSELQPAFAEATAAEVAAAAEKARTAAAPFADLDADLRAAFLDAIGDQVLSLGDELLERTRSETALPRPRLEGERGRTVGQLHMFAELLREGSWVEARIDRAQPEREPLPKPDLRRMLMPLGPAAVFGASNFPLAFSVAGGDTASALAAGCPVVAKAHPAHPGTSELVARAILQAAAETGMPEGVFSLVHGLSHQVGEALVTQPAIRAVGFTGSFRGGKALFDLACRRPEPIPVFAEMGSSNPVFVLPEALAERGGAIAEGLAASVTLGGGQFCTNPGLAVVQRGAAADSFVERAATLLGEAGACTMVHPGIKSSYAAALDELAALEGVAIVARSTTSGSWAETTAPPALLATDGATYRRQARLREELYGPATVIVSCGSRQELLDLARSLDGHLTATIHATEEDLREYHELLAVLRGKVGRLILNGFPTGVEVCPSMHHGGPFPATTDPRTTSVGTAAIQRFSRPICYQSFPQEALPAELRDDNPRRIWRLVDGQLSRDAI